MTSIHTLREAIGPVDAWRPRAQSLAHALCAGRHGLSFDLQRVFSLLPPDQQSGEAAFHLAEALPRTPDRGNRAALLQDKVPFLRQRILALAAAPLVRLGIDALAGQFVYAQRIEDALSRASREKQSCFSFDMLGEGARTAEDAKRNLAKYAVAVAAVGRISPHRHGVSIKLSSIHERYDALSFPRIRGQLFERLLGLSRAAAASGIGLTIDAEESERLALQLDLFAELSAQPELSGWAGLGIAVQAYHTDILRTVKHLAAMARLRVQRGAAPLCVRLVKGAYWDAEVKRAQELGLEHYPVFTDKCCTDLAYIAAARMLLDQTDALFPQFATHNPITLGCVLALAGTRRMECQRLYGMGEALQRSLRRLAPRTGDARLRASWPTPGSARLSAAPSAGERRQHLLCPSGGLCCRSGISARRWI